MGTLLPRGLLLLLGGAAVLLAVGGSGSSSHSMRNFYMAVSEPGQGLPQFIAVGYVDDQPIAHYDSNTRRKVPVAPWMEKVGKEDPQYWERNTQILQGWESMSRVDLTTLRNRFKQQNSTGLHTWQLMYGCEVGPEGLLRGGHRQYGYDGEDFIALDRETLTWTARVPQAQETKRRWEGEAHEAQRFNAYLEEVCAPWLRRYLDYGKEALRRTEAPAGRVSHKKVNSVHEILICRLDGFYPKEIDVTWMKDGEDRKPETQTGGVIPNSDGTYHTWLSIEVDPKEKDHYQCRVEHDSLQKPLELVLESASNLWLILGIVGGLLAALILVGAGAACYMKKQQEKKGYEAASGSDQGSDASAKISIPA